MVIWVAGMTQWRIQDFPQGGVDPLGGVDLWCRCFSAKMYVKMKELGPIGGQGCVPGTPPPPRSANVTCMIHSVNLNSTPLISMAKDIDEPPNKCNPDINSRACLIYQGPPKEKCLLFARNYNMIFLTSCPFKVIEKGPCVVSSNIASVQLHR